MSKNAVLFVNDKPIALVTSFEVPLLKAHVKGFTKRDGTYVAPHDTKAKTKQIALFGNPKGIVGAQFGGTTPIGKKPGSLFASGPASTQYPDAEDHPQLNDKGYPVQINKPSQPTAPGTWTNPAALATFVPDGDAPDFINGVALAEWTDAPTSLAMWAAVPGTMPDLQEPPMPDAKMSDGKPKEHAAGVLIEEPDGRVWVMRPTNGFGGYEATFPKGRADDGLSLQASAIKEAFEETGLQVEITGYLGDIERTTTVARYYTARRVGGTPQHMGWEAQAVQLVPPALLPMVLNSPIDHKIIAMRQK